MAGRSWAVVLGLSVAVCGVAVVAGPVRVPTPGMHAQEKKDKPKRTEDEDDAPKSVTPEVTRIDDPDVKPAAPKAKASGDLAQAARETRHPRAKELLAYLAVPHDEVIVNGYKGITVDGAKPPDGNLHVAPLVEPLDDTKGDVELQLVDDDGKPTRSIKVGRKRILSARYYEQIAVEKVKDFLDTPFGKYDPGSALYLGRLDQIQFGETALTGVLQWDQSARERGTRKGIGWEKVEADLRLALLGVKLTRLDLLAEAKSWDAAFDLGQQLAATFDRPAEHAQIALPLGVILKKAIADEAYTRDRFREVRRRLRQIEEQFPDSKLVDPINANLRDQAQEFFDRAKRLVEQKKPAEADALLRQAEETWPDLHGLRNYHLEFMGKFQILRVGMRDLPLYLSPGWAHTDAERRACELIFESLVALTPDEQGSLYYRPVLARSRPQVIALGRRFDLPRDAKWSDNNPVTVSDLSFTLKQIKDSGRGSERGPAWGDLLAGVQAEGSPFRMKLRLNQGMIDPLSAMSFKVLPQRARGAAEKEFAKKPIGSGPFVFDGRLSEQGTGREFASFKANPHYGARDNRAGLPHIRELRIYAPEDLVKEIKADRLDMVVDLSAAQAADLSNDPAIEVRLPTPKTVNRRVYFLAINHRKPTLANAELRVALALAIQRDKLLDDHFRRGLGKKVHRSINGPYPAGSWACSPLLVGKADDPTLDPFDKELATTKLHAARLKLGEGDIALSLRHPSGDPALADAIAALCEQVNARLAGVKLKPEPTTPHELRDAVEQTHAYDLAYYSYDFPDESYWLKPLLGGENYLGYTGPLQGNIERASTLRHFSQVQEYTHAIHRQLLEAEMPLIPLWQLDPLIAVRKGRVEMPAIDPQALFTRVEEWRVRGAGR